MKGAPTLRRDSTTWDIKILPISLPDAEKKRAKANHQKCQELAPVARFSCFAYQGNSKFEQADQND